MISSDDFENKNVHKVYNNIAEHFSVTRFKIWNKVNKFIDSFKRNSLILDIGCGNGKNMGTRDDCNYIGIDICEKLIEQAQLHNKNNCKYIVGNCLKINMPDNLFDYVMSIAVIHHLSNNQRRIESIKEIVRLLKPEGQALIYVWSFEQPKFKNKKSQDIYVKWKLQKKYSKDKEEDEDYMRYYHLFKKYELENIIGDLNDVKIVESGNECNNWYCIIEKIL